MSMVTVQATTGFSTYVAGDCITVAAGQMVQLPSDKAETLREAGLVLPPGQKAPERKKTAVGGTRVVSDVVPDPEDVTDEEKAANDDAATGRKRQVDPSIARSRRVEERLGARGSKARKARQSGEGPVAKEGATAEDLSPDGYGAGPEGAHTNPADDGLAAKGAYTTAREDVSSGSKPASQPVKTGQGRATRKPGKTGEGRVADEDKPESEDPDGLGAPDPIETVGDKDEHVAHTGPKDDPAAGTEGKGDANPHPSPGTVK